MMNLKLWNSWIFVFKHIMKFTFYLFYDQFIAINRHGHLLLKIEAAYIIKTCQMLIEDYASEVPQTREALESLPGVGRKTANVVMNTAFGEPTIAVDTHIFRVSNRTGIAPGKNPLEVEKGLLRSTPEEFKKDAHHWLILHGRYVCKARKPLCGECTIIDWCEYRNKELA